MFWEYHIIVETDENTAYPVLEETIRPCFSIGGQEVEVINLDIKNNNCTFNPLEFNKSNLSKEEIISKVQEIVQLYKVANRYVKVKDILEQVCLKNELVLSDKDKENILSFLK